MKGLFGQALLCRNIRCNFGGDGAGAGTRARPFRPNPGPPLDEGECMQPSMFNVRVPLDSTGRHDDVFLMNTFTDAQLIVSRDVASLLDRLGSSESAALTHSERD